MTGGGFIAPATHDKPANLGEERLSNPRINAPRYQENSRQHLVRPTTRRVIDAV